MATTYNVESYLAALGTNSVEPGSTISDTADAIKPIVVIENFADNIAEIIITDTAFSLTPTQYDLLTQHGWSGPDGQTFTLEVTAAELRAQVDNERGAFTADDNVMGYGLAARDHAGGVKTIWRYAQSPVRPALRPV